MLEELDAVRAIFEDGVAVDAATLSVRVVGRGAGAVIYLRPDYPTTPPTFELEGLSRAAATALRAELSAAGLECRGAPMLYQLIILAREALGVIAPLRDDIDDDLAEAAPPTIASRPAPAYPVTHGPTIIERKSGFQAHVARVHSSADVSSALDAILSSSPRMARATHHMRAFRFEGAGGALVADNDDDGEDAAGGRLAQLLELMGARNVLVVVSRWFGGTLLGPSRFAVICNVARELLAAEGFECRKQ